MRPEQLDIGRVFTRIFETYRDVPTKSVSQARSERNLDRAELVRRLADVSHRTWMRQKHRDQGVPYEDLPAEATEHDLERAEDIVLELERLGLGASSSDRRSRPNR